MIQIKCECRAKFRVQYPTNETLCRACYKRNYGKPRPITSRVKVKRVRMRKISQQVIKSANKRKAHNIDNSMD